MTNPRLSGGLKQTSAPRRAARRAGEIAAGGLRFLRRDWLSAVLLIASIAIAITFFVLLGSLDRDAEGETTSLTATDQSSGTGT